MTEHHHLCENLRAELSKAQHDLSTLHSTLTSHVNDAGKQVSRLEDDLRAEEQHVSSVKANLQDSLAKQAAAHDTIQSLNSTIEDLQQQLHAGTEHIAGLSSDLQAKTSAHEELTAEHKSSVDKCQELSASLQQSEEALQARTLELEQAAAALECERLTKVSLGCHAMKHICLSQIMLFDHCEHLQFLCHH